jgi:hypothetical protein
MYAVFFEGIEVCLASERAVPEIQATFECFVDHVSRTIVLLR